MPVAAEIYATFAKRIDDAAREAVSADLVEAVGPTRFLKLTFKPAHRPEDVLEREPDHDLPPDNLPASQHILRIYLSTPYYGPGYERGAWPEIVSVLEFLIRRLPTAQIWYGPDSGDLVDEVTPQMLDQLWQHWAEHGGRPYYSKRADRGIGPVT